MAQFLRRAAAVPACKTLTARLLYPVGSTPAQPLLLGQIHGQPSFPRCGFCTSSNAQQLIYSSDHKNLVLNSDPLPDNLKGKTTVVTGPSRQGKSHLMDLLVGRAVFGVSHDPMFPKTFGAWQSVCSSGNLIVDTEGQSHSVSDATVRLFSAIYPISQNLIWSDKSLGSDKFFQMLEDLSAKMKDYKKGSSAHKPRLVLVIRDNSYEFKDRDEGNTITCDAYVQKYVTPKLMRHDLFSSVRGVALADLRNLTPGSPEADEELKELGAILAEDHPGPLISLTDKDNMQLLMKVVNEKGFFDLAEMTKVLIDNLSPFRDAMTSRENDNTLLAERFGWDEKKITASFQGACARVEGLCKQFPEQLSNVQQTFLSDLKDKMKSFIDRVKHKTEAFETETQEQVVSYDRKVMADDGGNSGKGTVIGALGGAGAFVGIAAATTGPVGMIAALAAPAVFTAAGAVAGESCRSTKEIIVKDAKVVETKVKKFKGYKLGAPTK